MYACVATLTMCGFAQDLADKLYEKKWNYQTPIPMPRT